MASPRALGPAGRVLAALVLCACCALPLAAEPRPDPAEPGPGERGETVADDATHLEALAFPGVRYRDALRLQAETRFVPESDVGNGHVTLYRPDLRGRLTVPIGDRAVLRVSALGSMGRYEFRGPDPFFDDSLDVWQTRLAIQGAYRVNDDDAFLFERGERWSLLAAIEGASEFESGAFDDGLSTGGSLALGFELPGSLRIAGGVSLSTSPEDGGVDLGPTGFLRWNVTDAFTLRNRGLGLQLEYRWNPRLELFVSGFRATDRYALSTTACPAPSCVGPTVLLDDLVLHDRAFLTGAGFEWKISPHVRVNTEIGAVAWRRLRVRSDDLGTVVSRRGEPAPYFELRFEVRP